MIRSLPRERQQRDAPQLRVRGKQQRVIGARELAEPWPAARRELRRERVNRIDEQTRRRARPRVGPRTISKCRIS